MQSRGHYGDCYCRWIWVWLTVDGCFVNATVSWSVEVKPDKLNELLLTERTNVSFQAHLVLQRWRDYVFRYQVRDQMYYSSWWALSSCWIWMMQEKRSGAANMEDRSKVEILGEVLLASVISCEEWITGMTGGIIMIIIGQ